VGQDFRAGEGAALGHECLVYEEVIVRIDHAIVVQVAGHITQGHREGVHEGFVEYEVIVRIDHAVEVHITVEGVLYQDRVVVDRLTVEGGVGRSADAGGVAVADFRQREKVEPFGDVERAGVRRGEAVAVPLGLAVNIDPVLCRDDEAGGGGLDRGAIGRGGLDDQVVVGQIELGGGSGGGAAESQVLRMLTVALPEVNRAAVKVRFRMEA